MPQTRMKRRWERGRGRRQEDGDERRPLKNMNKKTRESGKTDKLR